MKGKGTRLKHISQGFPCTWPRNTFLNAIKGVYNRFIYHKKICKQFSKKLYSVPVTSHLAISVLQVKLMSATFVTIFFSHSTNSSTSSWETSWNLYTTCCRSSDDKNKNKYFLRSNKQAEIINMIITVGYFLIE